MNSSHLELLNFQLCHLNSGRLPASTKVILPCPAVLQKLSWKQTEQLWGSLCWLPLSRGAPSCANCCPVSEKHSRLLCKLNSVLFEADWDSFSMCSNPPPPPLIFLSHPRGWTGCWISREYIIPSNRQIHVMKEMVKQANRTQSKTEKQHTALGRRYFKLTESIFTNATGQHYRQAWSVWFPVRLLLLLLLCFALIRDSGEDARGLELNKSWRQISFINTAKGVVGGDCSWDI